MKIHVFHRQAGFSKTIHGCKTAGTALCTHAYSWKTGLIFIGFQELSTEKPVLYYYDYFFIRLLKNN
ncbi:hypothetical protein [Comamonas sp. lk]|uniref:hypothetical protein n=1 Tax=Comamonas sp. lk TaxID=2201272 RepID=UPI0013CF3523|nr:hypothetical protein [Comamonas sp. lk]